MSIFKGNLNSENLLTANDEIRGVLLIAPSTAPAYFGMETGDSVKWYMWWDDSDNLRKHTSAPTAATRNSAGSVIAGASNAGASTNLSNLASTAVNVALISDTDVTDDLGSSSIRWKDTYTQDLYFISTTEYISGSTAGKIIFEATTAIEVGVDDNGVDFKFFGATAGSYMLWDESADSLLLTDSTLIKIGDSQDVTLEWDGTDAELDFAAANSVFNFGNVYPSDFIFHGSTATSDAGWDASADTFQIADDAIFSIGGTGIGTHDGIKMFYNAVAASLDIDARTANDTITIGSNTVTDVSIQGSNYDILFDGSQDAWVMQDLCELALGTSLDVYMRYDGTGNTLDIGQTADGTGAIDFIDIGVIMTGADSLGAMLAITGIDTTGNSDTVTIDHSGTGAALYIDLNEADSLGIELEAFTNQTTSGMVFDGTTAGWIGANDVGFLHIKNDIALANAGASLLYLTESGTPIASAEGFLARFIHTGTATTTAYAVEIEVPATQPALASNGIVKITGQDSPGASILQVVGNDLTGNSDSITFNGEGTGSVLKITGDDVDSVGLTIVGQASHTVSLGIIDGSTANWIGANDVGMFHLKADTALAHAGASQLQVVNTAQPITAAEGYLARFVSTGTARADAVAVEIAAKDGTEDALKISAGRLSVAGDSTFTGAGTFTNGYQADAVARTATADGTGTGTIADGTTYVTVTAGADANSIIILPAPTPGNVVWLFIGATGYELRSSAPASVAINGGSGAGAESAIAANTLVRMICTSATTWVGTQFDTAGTETAVQVAAA